MRSGHLLTNRNVFFPASSFYSGCEIDVPPAPARCWPLSQISTKSVTPMMVILKMTTLANDVFPEGDKVFYTAPVVLSSEIVLVPNLWFLVSAEPGRSPHHHSDALQSWRNMGVRAYSPRDRKMRHITFRSSSRRRTSGRVWNSAANQRLSLHSTRIFSITLQYPGPVIDRSTQRRSQVQVHEFEYDTCLGGLRARVPDLRAWCGAVAPSLAPDWTVGLYKYYTSVAKIVLPAGSRPRRSWAPENAEIFGDMMASRLRDHRYPAWKLSTAQITQPDEVVVKYST